MFRSIRWSLLLWHALILLSVLTGFGSILYFELARSMARETDSELAARARDLANVLKIERGRPLKVQRTDEYARRVGALEGSAFYYAVLGPRGEVVDRSAGGPEIVVDASLPPSLVDEPFSDGTPPGLAKRGGLPPGLAKKGKIPPGLARRATRPPGERPEDETAADAGMGGDAKPRLGRDDLGREEPVAVHADRPELRDRGPWREAGVEAFRGVKVVVGRHTGEMHRRLAEILRIGLATGVGILALAVAGDWFLSGRALRPIGQMAAVAAGISASNLTQRLDVARTESELGALAVVLNGTFDRLKAAFDRQARFTADASHELRTPLAVVIAHAEVSLRKERTASEYRETVATCLKASRRMQDIVEGLLTLARSDACEIGLRKVRFDLAELVREVAAFLEPLAAARQVGIEVVGDVIEFQGDPDRLREVVGNLVSNAIRYNRDGGRVHVSVLRDGEAAVVTVADTGIGIPEDDLPHVFERFYRVDRARSRGLGGAGLGLAIVKWGVEAHGGSISCSSEVERGTTFSARLPILSDETPD